MTAITASPSSSRHAGRFLSAANPPLSTAAADDSKVAAIRRRKRSAAELLDNRVTSSTDHDQHHKPQPVDCSKCRYRCTNSFSHQQRLQICQLFHSLLQNSRHLEFIDRYIVENSPKTRVLDAREHRAVSRHYYLPIPDLPAVGLNCLAAAAAACDKRQSLERGLRVCCKFFCKTIAVTTWTIERWMETRRQELPPPENNSNAVAKQNPVGSAFNSSQLLIRRSDLQRQLIRQHILMFPTMDSRENTKCSYKFLEWNLNVAKMYQLFRQFCDNLKHSNYDLLRRYSNSDSDFVPSENEYRNVFNSDFKLGFAQLPTIVTVTTEQQHTATTPPAVTMDVIEINTDVNRMLQSHRQQYLTATVSMINVLHIPAGEINMADYRRRLLLYYITIHDSLNNGLCYLWPETDGNCGVNELASVIYKYLSTVATSVSSVNLFIENCDSGSQKHSLCALLCHAVRSLPGLASIQLKFTTAGYCYANSQALQSAIRHAYSYQTIYVVYDWINIIRGARRDNPYSVKQLSFNDFYDVSKLSDELLPDVGCCVSTSDDTVDWTALKSVHIDRYNPTEILYKTSFKQRDFSVIELKPTSTVFGNSHQLKTVYSQQLPISHLKKRDLLSMCQQNDIVSVYHNFYECLPASSTVCDVVPECLLELIDDDVTVPRDWAQHLTTEQYDVDSNNTNVSGRVHTTACHQLPQFWSSRPSDQSPTCLGVVTLSTCSNNNNNINRHQTTPTAAATTKRRRRSASE